MCKDQRGERGLALWDLQREEGRGELGEFAGASPGGWSDPGRGRAEPVRVREGGLARAFQTADSSPTEDVGARGPDRGHGDFSGPYQPHQPCAPSSALSLTQEKKTLGV